ncbi:MAG: hypothetical protein DHS20C11_25950 [Lysobacteraceae bacterium]|nr:MAG: hypothetical protein DHS20C11_25950 [Xanthomonadaceae bacterium]
MIYEPGQDKNRSQARRKLAVTMFRIRMARAFNTRWARLRNWYQQYKPTWPNVPKPLKSVPKLRLPSSNGHGHKVVASVCVAIVVAGVALIISPPSVARYILKTVELPTVEPQPVIEEQDWQWRETKIANGQTLAAAFAEQGLTATDVHRVVNLNEQTSQLSKIFPGDDLAFAFDDADNWQALRYTPRSGPILEVVRGEEGLSSHSIERSIEVRVDMASGVIDDSLFLAGQAAGLADNTIMQIASIFGWDVDFVRDVWAGDSFQVVYETRYRDGEPIGQGEILAARFVNRDRVYEALRYTRENGETDYYSPEGRPMRKAFLRSPLDVTRVTSRFTLKRYHPVLKIYRPHRGVDYGASTGTPVRATGDGKVIFASKNSSYGNHVIIQHGSEYKTLYAHLSKFGRGVKKGVRVRQGQVIGLSGATGLVTAPHLHYEFRVNDAHRDPLRMKFPEAAPLPEAELERFVSMTSVLSAQLSLKDASLASVGP